MQQQEFELAMSKFFDKAGVQIVKKGEEFDNIEGYPSYILLDIKRKAYYAAESDVYDGNINNPVISQFSTESFLNINNARAVYSLSQAMYILNENFALNNGIDISALARKSALVISDENSAEVKSYLENNGYKFQSVPLKGQFLVIFIDESMHSQLTSIYLNYNNMESEIEKDLSLDDEDDDIAPVFEPKDEKEEDLSLDINDNNKKDDNAKKENKEAVNQEDIDEEELLDNIDLNDLIKPTETEDIPKDETEADLLYGKFLNEQTEKIEVSESGPVEKSIDEIPEGLIDEEDIKEMTSESSEENTTTGDKKTNSKEDKKAAKLKAKEEKKQARLAKKREQEAQKYTYENRNKPWLDLPGRIVANIIGVLFFFPAYILNKIVSRFLPSFVIYWLAAIVAVYGVYQMAFSLIPQPFSDVFQETANEAMQHMQAFHIDENNKAVGSDVAETSLNMMKTCAIMFYAFLKIIDVVMDKGILLHYLLGFAASLLIIPAFRFIGKTLTIFSVLSYILLPLVSYSQSKLILYAFTLSEINLTAAAVMFLVYIYPIILFFAVLYISSAIVPDANTRKEVLP